MSKIKDKYTDYYKSSNGNMYPTEWLIRTFRGKYPNLRFDPSTMKSKILLELGFGDGRNMPLFQELGFKLNGIEVSQDICSTANKKLLGLNINANLQEGANHLTPFENNYFDCVVACHSFYYVSEGTSFNDNLKELVRILKPGGWFIADLVDDDTYLFKNAINIGDNLYRCTNDPFGGVRDGALFQAFNSVQEIEDIFSPFFKFFSFGSQLNNFYGSKQNHFLVACMKK